MAHTISFFSPTCLTSLLRPSLRGSTLRCSRPCRQQRRRPDWPPWSASSSRQPCAELGSRWAVDDSPLVIIMLVVTHSNHHLPLEPACLMPANAPWQHAAILAHQSCHVTFVFGFRVIVSSSCSHHRQLENPANSPCTCKPPAGCARAALPGAPSVRAQVCAGGHLHAPQGGTGGRQEGVQRGNCVSSSQLAGCCSFLLLDADCTSNHGCMRGRWSNG